MWDINPHKSVSSQTIRKRTWRAFLVLLFSILWKKNKLHFKFQSIILRTVFKISSLKGSKYIKLSRYSQCKYGEKLSASNGNIERGLLILYFKIKSFFSGLCAEAYLKLSNILCWSDPGSGHIWKFFVKVWVKKVEQLGAPGWFSWLGVWLLILAYDLGVMGSRVPYPVQSA